MYRKINKMLVAGRGEIAVRVIRTLKRLDITSVAVYAADDADALYVRMADEAYPLGEGQLSDTYLNISKIVNIAVDSGCDAVHPGYGFLSENPDFAKACADANVVFIGPGSDVIRLMGNKVAARKCAIESGIPVTWGVTGSISEILSQADAMPYPVLIKAAGGGGGKAMHIVNNKSDLETELRRASDEALRYFGDGTVFVEQYVVDPRHIEVQVLADMYGNVIHLFERECTIQRRYQKIIEESPSPTLNDDKRVLLFEAAVSLCRRIGYCNAGTVEFIVDREQNFYFLEMNTRIQVEHPVTELCTGVDIVEEQINIAQGRPLEIGQSDVKSSGHSIELRIYAEDPTNEFMPSPGDVTAYHEPQLLGTRIDSSIDGPCRISGVYDPMIAKLVCHAKDRQSAIETAQRALYDFIIQGITTNKAYLWEIVRDKDFAENNISTHFCRNHKEKLLQALDDSRKSVCVNDIVITFLLFDLFKKQFSDKTQNVWEHIGYWRYIMRVPVSIEEKERIVNIKNISKGSIGGDIDGKAFSAQITQVNGNQMKLKINGRSETAYCSVNAENKTIVNLRGLNFICSRNDQLDETFDYSKGKLFNDQKTLTSPMPGKVIKINVKEGDEVKKGSVMIVVEAMKMENNIIAAEDARVKKVLVKQDEMVDNKMQLIELDEL